jgi:hypothetical protein
MDNDILRHVNTRLRHQLQTAESRQRQAWRRLEDFREHLLAVGQIIPIIDMTALLAELSELRLLLAGVEVDHG